MTASSSLRLARLIALLVPSALLGGALISQYVGGLYPCEMCMWQRWPHLLAIILSLAAFAAGSRVPLSLTLTALAAASIASSGVIGAFHAGVEYGWWEGLSACAIPATGGSTQALLDSIMSAPLTRCDVAPWSMFGISLAGYNAILSLAAAAAITMLMLRQDRKIP